MPTRLHLEILTGTYKFHDFFKFDIGWDKFSLYRMTNRWGGEKVVCIYQSSKKCYRVMYCDKWNIKIRGESLGNGCEYRSFRTQWELCRYLDTLV